MGVFHFEGVSGKFGLDSSSFREVRATYSHKTWSLPDDLVISGNFLPIIVTKSIMQPSAGPDALLSSPILTSAPWGPALIKDTPTKLCFRVHLGGGQRTQAKTLNFFTYLCFFRINSYIWNCWVNILFFDFFFYWNLVDLQCCFCQSTFFYLFIFQHQVLVAACGIFQSESVGSFFIVAHGLLSGCTALA